MSPLPAATATPLRDIVADCWRRQPRALPILLALCLGIALMLTAMSRDSLGINLVYSFAIGLCCGYLTEGTAVVLAWLQARWRMARGLPAFEAGGRPIRRTLARMLPAGVIGVALGAPLGMGIGNWIFGVPEAARWALPGNALRFTLALSLAAMVVAVIGGVLVEYLARARAEAEIARRQAAENQLRLLQSQLEPHMLFNTLANLRVLIGVDAERAQAMLDRLIQFLRGTLAASRVATQPLDDEFRHTADYLALMAVRMGPRLAVRLELPDELKAVRVPTLLLQPLVENAIKHGLEPKVDGGRVEVAARREGGVLVLSVRDTGLGLAAAAGSPGSSFGLAQVRERLATLHGDAASLTLQDAPGGEGALATIRLPLPAVA